MGFPRRARWKFIFCLEFDMNSLLNNWDNYEVLRMKFWGFIVTIIFIYGSFLTLRCFCLQFWNFAVLNVLHMHYLVLFLICSYVCTCTPALLYPIPFLMYCFPGITILPTSPHSFKALLSFVLFLLTLLLLTLLVVSPCPKVVVMTLNFTNKPVFITRKWNRPLPHTGGLFVLRLWDPARFTVLHELHIHLISQTSNFILAVINTVSMLLL